MKYFFKLYINDNALSTIIDKILPQTVLFNHTNTLVYGNK